MEIGTGVDHQGHWIDGACQESVIYAICEKSGSAPTPPPPTCPGGWEEYEDSCYRAMEGKMTWEEAEIACVMEEVSLSLSVIFLLPPTNPLTAGTLGLHQRSGRERLCLREIPQLGGKALAGRPRHLPWL